MHVFQKGKTDMSTTYLKKKENLLKYFHKSSLGEPIESMIISTEEGGGEVQKGLQRGGES